MPEFDEYQALDQAIAAGKLSPCCKSKRGVVVWNPEPGTRCRPLDAFNGPPPGFCCDGSETCRRTCGKTCIHAEARALFAAGSEPYTDLLHVKVVDGQPVPSGPPSCPECSKLIVERGIKRVWLLHETATGVRQDRPVVSLRLYSALDFHIQTLNHNQLPVIRERKDLDSE